MHVLMRPDGVNIKQSEVITLSNTRTTSSSLVCQSLAFVDTMQMLVSYAGALELVGGKSFMD